MQAAVGRATVIADGGCRGTGLLIPYRRARGQTELPAWREEHNTSHRKVRARVEHVFARLHNLALAGQLPPRTRPERPKEGGSPP